MKAWMRIVAVLASAALFCAAQTGTPSSPAPPATPESQEPVPEPQTVAPPVPESSATPPLATSPEDIPLPPPVKKPGAAQGGAASGPATGAAPAPANLYVIGALDVLYVRVWNNGNLTGMVNVRDDGMISMPLIGELKADGLTVEQLRNLIKTKLDDYLNNPEVSVDVTRNNSKKFYILGGVNRPGAFPLNGKMTISEALSTAGGFRDFANQKKIYLLRGAVKHMFNYKDVIAGKHLEQDIEIESGDKIVVPE